MKYFELEDGEYSWYVRAWIWAFSVLIRRHPKEIKSIKADFY